MKNFASLAASAPLLLAQPHGNHGNNQNPKLWQKEKEHLRDAQEENNHIIGEIAELDEKVYAFFHAPAFERKIAELTPDQQQQFKILKQIGRQPLFKIHKQYERLAQTIDLFDHGLNDIADLLGDEFKDMFEVQDDPCGDDPCQNGGQCFDAHHIEDWQLIYPDALYSCECPLGWEGKNCEVAKCYCDYGVASDVGECPSPNAHHCQSCDGNLILDDDHQCVDQIYHFFSDSNRGGYWSEGMIAYSQVFDPTVFYQSSIGSEPSSDVQNRIEPYFDETLGSSVATWYKTLITTSSDPGDRYLGYIDFRNQMAGRTNCDISISFMFAWDDLPDPNNYEHFVITVGDGIYYPVMDSLLDGRQMDNCVGGMWCKYEKLVHYDNPDQPLHLLLEVNLVESSFIMNIHDFKVKVLPGCSLE